MATTKQLKKRYTILHRYMCGLTIFCIIVTIIGGTKAGASATEIALRAAMVAISLFFAEFVILKIWASWEDIQQGATSYSDE